MTNEVRIHGDVVWFVNPTTFNHKTNCFNLLCDDSFLRMLHIVYGQLGDLTSVNVIIPKVDDNTFDELININENFFENKLEFQTLDMYGTTYQSNMEVFSANFEANSKILNLLIEPCDIVVSEFDYDFGFEVIWLLPYFNTNLTVEDISKSNENIGDLILKYDELFFHLGVPNRSFSKELFKEMVEYYTSQEKPKQVSDLLNVLQGGYKVLVYDKPLEHNLSELETLFMQDGYLDTINTIIITNQSDLDDSASLDILFNVAQKEDRKEKVKLVLLDKSDDFNKSTLKFILANYPDAICYFTMDERPTHDLMLYRELGCQVKAINSTMLDNFIN